MKLEPRSDTVAAATRCVRLLASSDSLKKFAFNAKATIEDSIVAFALETRFERKKREAARFFLNGNARRQTLSPRGRAMTNSLLTALFFSQTAHDVFWRAVIGPFLIALGGLILLWRKRL